MEKESAIEVVTLPKTHKIVLDTSLGQAVFSTPILKGKLAALIISSDVKVEIIIQSELGYLIFHDREHSGIKYRAPRSVLQAPEQKLTTQTQFDNFLLDEKLDIIVRGPKNQEVSIEIRLD